MLYALLDRSKLIRPAHLEAALALWDCAEASVTHIFGDLTGDADADRIMAALRRVGPMSASDIYELFGRHGGAVRTSRGLELLVAAGKLTVSQEVTGGRPRTIYMPRLVGVHRAA